MEKTYLDKFIDISLTYDSANDRGYEWTGDVLSSFNEDAYFQKFYDLLDNYKCLLGQPYPRKEKDIHVNDTWYGFYEPIRTANDLLPDLIDYTLNLTPENCRAKGYDWVDDIYYDRTESYFDMYDIIYNVQKKGYKLGATVSRMNEDKPEHYGLYAPLEKQS